MKPFGLYMKSIMKESRIEIMRTLGTNNQENQPSLTNQSTFSGNKFSKQISQKFMYTLSNTLKLITVNLTF